MPVNPSPEAPIISQPAHLSRSNHHRVAAIWIALASLLNEEMGA